MAVTVPNAAAVKTIYFGLDISKAHFDAASRQTGLAPVQPHELRSIKTNRFERTLAGAQKFMKMVRETAGQARSVIVMESTGSYSLELCHWLWQVNPDILIADVPPKRIHNWSAGTGARAKTDKIDAGLIACYGAERQPRVQGPGNEIYAKLRALTRTRESFVADRQALQQRLEEAGREHIDKKTAKMLTGTYQRIIKETEKSIAKLEDEIKRLLASQAELKADFELGDSLPGMGLITVATIFSEAGDLRRFNSRELVAFAGLDPVTCESGSSVRSPRRITRRGNTRIRRILANAAWASTRTKNDNPFKATFQRLTARGKPILVALSAVMKKMLTTLRAALIAGHYTPVDILCGTCAQTTKNNT